MFPISEKTIQRLIIKGKQLIDSHSVIFFDVFDTLLTRDCAQPSNVFELVEKVYNKQEETCPLHDFKRIRKAAEKKCAQNIFAPNLDEIYEYFPLDVEKKSKLKAIEIEIEQKLSIQKYTGYTLYRYAKEQKKTIVAVSDMYLGADIISKMLISAGYEVNNVIVSCDKRAEKYNGRLFQVAIKEIAAIKNDVVHFGDNLITDIFGAMRAGISCLWIPARKNLAYFKKSSDSFADNYLLPFVANRVPLIENKVTALGYETCGPMIVGFCQWLHQKLHDGRYNKALFCARDMLQTYQIYLKMYPEDKDLACYFYVSRKSLKPAYEAAKGNDKSPESIQQLKYLRKYINQLGCQGKVALIDSGLYGTSQKMLTDILQGSIELHGLYMRITKVFFDNVTDPETYVYMNPVQPNVKHMINSMFFETMVAAVHGRTIGYTRSHNSGKIEPIFGKSQPDLLKIEKFHKGIELFVRDYKDSFFSENIINERAVRDVMLRLGFFPQQEDVQLLKDLKCGNENYEPIIVKRERLHYFYNTFDLFRDLKHTCWKGGFLQKCFSCGAPIICKIYLIFDCLIIYLLGDGVNLEHSVKMK